MASLLTDLDQIIPLALTIALSPIPIVGMLLMLLSERGYRSGMAFTLGWIVGIAFSATALSLLVSLLPLPSGEGPRRIFNVVPVVLGVGLILVAIRGRRKSRQSDDGAMVPRWLSAFDNLTARRAAIFGFVYAAFRPKNLAVAIAAGVVILREDRGRASVIASLVVFIVIAASTMLAPVVLFLAGGTAGRAFLVRVRQAIVANISAITSISFAAIGLFLTVVGLIGLLP
jgi:hypothetical protein